MIEKTVRQRIESVLRDRPTEMSATAISDHLSDFGVRLTPEDVIEEMEHVAESCDDQVLVSPPRCKECGFHEFDVVSNAPSSCPRCQSTWIADPRYTIDAE